VAVCCSRLKRILEALGTLMLRVVWANNSIYNSMLQRGAVFCSLCCSVLQYVAAILGGSSDPYVVITIGEYM